VLGCPRVVDHEEPRRVDHEARPEAHDGDHVLRLVEELAHEPGAPRRLLARALEPVLHFAILEVLQVEGRRVLHEAQAHRDAEALAEQRIEKRDAAAEDVGDHGEREFQREKAPDRIEVVALDARHDRIDDERTDVQSRDREQRADEAERDHRDADRGTRLPDELEEGREVTEGAYALAEGGGRLRRGAA